MFKILVAEDDEQLRQLFCRVLSRNGFTAIPAKDGQDALEKMISMDETAGYLGECALIDYRSPISDMGILFYNTLYDENASCHVALGRGFENCIANYEKYTREQLHEMGINDSMIHVDFMIGTADLAITGIRNDGSRVEIFRDGSWCF